MASNVKPTPWFRRILGPDFIQCNDDLRLISIDSVLKLSETCLEVVGLYFTPMVTVDDNHVTTKLVDLYRQANGWRDNNVDQEVDVSEVSKKKFEVIQIVLSTNVDCLVKMTDTEESFKKHIKNLPWFAVPYHDFQRKGRLGRRYHAKTAAPTLVLLEADTGRVITGGGCERLEADPGGEGFPWRPRPVVEVLQDGMLVSGARRETTSARELKGCVQALYFSAHWCPPCKAFTPQLVETYTKVKARGEKFEVIFVSSDRSLESFSLYLATMPWLAVPYENEERRRELASLFGIQGIPTLVLLDTDGKVITDDGRGEVNEDPDGLNFPWRPKLVNLLTERYAAKLHDQPAIILFVEGEDGELEFAESVLLPAVQEYRLHYQPDEDEDYLQFFIGCDCDTSDLLREFVGIDDSVPLLTAVDIPSGRMGVMEDGAELTEQSVKSFVARFLDGTLLMTDIVLNDIQMTLGAMSMI